MGMGVYFLDFILFFYDVTVGKVLKKKLYNIKL